jgi:alkanesulfonate monooxygenase SsuD/methylene tetrahydromethanopterin reductase-like flavin-dependent oxidoreductase (luciferase family)
VSRPWAGRAGAPASRSTPSTEAVEIIRRAWSGERSVTFEGEHYRVNGFHPGPPPAHDVGVWIGAYRPRMLELTGRVGGGWIPSLGYAPPDAIPEMRKRLDDAAAAAGRDPEEIRRLYNVSGQIADGPVQALLRGPPDHWVETLTGFATELGFDTFVFSSREDQPGQIDRFAREVAPGVCEALAV